MKSWAIVFAVLAVVLFGTNTLEERRKAYGRFQRKVRPRNDRNWFQEKENDL